jgi:NADPH:quinone reductase-like Zn-dependent oxidoreductase
MQEMNAVRIYKPGGPESVVYERAPKPIPAPDDALVRVHAAAISPGEFSWFQDWSKPLIPSHEMSGVVAAIGATVREVNVGDAVYGLVDFSRDGAAAEFAALRAADLAPKPRSLDHVGACTMTLSALTAWQALRVHARLQAGQRVLIHGGAGGVGSYAVQLAKWMGAQTIATASAVNAAFVKELGADQVIDYTTARFEDAVREVDLVLDTVGGDALNRSWKVLQRGGTLLSVAEEPSAATAAGLGIRAVYFIVEPDRGHLIELAELADRGILKPIVSAVYPLARAREAYEMGVCGHMRGKIVLRAD